MNTTDAIPQALRLLGQFWLEEVKMEQIETIAALPELARALPSRDETALTDLAVEYQRLFSFNLPPYESIFIDPSAMLMAPAALRVQALYRQAGWQPPAGARVGAPDHLGLELLALADGMQFKPEFGRQLLSHHLALWGPPLILTLHRLKPQPFYAALAELTLELILALLPEPAQLSPDELFPALPPPPVYRGTGPLPAAVEAEETAETERGEPVNSDEEAELSLRALIRRLLSPRETGLYFSREDLARIGYTLALPGVMGERHRMLDHLFHQAGQYELLPALFEQLDRHFEEARQAYAHLAAGYPHWQPYAEAWQARLAATQALCNELKTMRT
jgi:TorA maturation chaperone TorD